MHRLIDISGVKSSMDMSRRGIHHIGVATLEASSRGRRTRPPISMRLGSGSEFVKASFDVKPLVLLLQGMVLPLCIVLWIIELIDLLIESIGKSCGEQVKCLHIVKVIPGVSSKLFKLGNIVVHVFPFHSKAWF